MTSSKQIIRPTKKVLHLIPSYFKNPNHPITIDVIGCGGTGSLLLPRLARLDSTLEALGHPGIHVRVYDDDKVEPHNIGRQNFTKADVGQHKAFNLVTKINQSFSLQWEAITNKIGNNIPKANITITCVDNTETRRNVAKAFDIRNGTYTQGHEKRYYWLDTGNGKDFGQVVLSTVAEFDNPSISTFHNQADLKNVFDIFGDNEVMESVEVQGIESCSVAQSLEKQDLFVNDTIANAASRIIWRLFREQTLASQGAVINTATDQILPLELKKQ